MQMLLYLDPENTNDTKILKKAHKAKLANKIPTTKCQKKHLKKMSLMPPQATVFGITLFSDTGGP